MEKISDYNKCSNLSYLLIMKKTSAQCDCLKKAVKDISQESLESDDTVINIQRDFSSEINLVGNRLFLSNKPSSESNIHYYTANYDDICGPWPSSNHPSLQRYDDSTIAPVLCAWKFITIQDMHNIIQNFSDRNVVESIFEKRLSANIIFNSKSKQLYFNLLWKFFKHMSNDNYSSKGISSVLGLFYLTHRFFLSDFWRSADETFTFFKKGLNLHILLNLPESDMVFNFFEYDKILDMFWSFYITRLELVRLISTPKYHLKYKI